MHELYAYARMRIYLTMGLTMKENTEINYYKTRNYTASEKIN